MLSRVASSIYWMSRYLERADNVARFIDVNALLILDMGWDRDNAQWEPLVLASGDQEDFNARYKEYTQNNVIKFLTFDLKNPNSVLSCVSYARENARTVREVISSEMWETLNALYHFVKKHSRKRKLDDLQEFYAQVHAANHMFVGLIENTMSHGEACQFAQFGRLLERADKTARLLDVKYFLLEHGQERVGSPSDTVAWGATLQSVSGSEMYRKQFHRANYRDISQFLILDHNFPRSIHFCVRQAAQALETIQNILDVDSLAPQPMQDLCVKLQGTDIETILQEGLHGFVDDIQQDLNAIDDAMYRSFFALDITETV